MLFTRKSVQRYYKKCIWARKIEKKSFFVYLFLIFICFSFCFFTGTIVIISLASWLSPCYVRCFASVNNLSQISIIKLNKNYHYCCVILQKVVPLRRKTNKKYDHEFSREPCLAIFGWPAHSLNVLVCRIADVHHSYWNTLRRTTI